MVASSTMAGPRSSSAVPLGPMTAPTRISPTSPGIPRRSNSGGTTRNKNAAMAKNSTGSTTGSAGT